MSRKANRRSSYNENVNSINVPEYENTHIVYSFSMVDLLQYKSKIKKKNNGSRKRKRYYIFAIDWFKQTMFIEVISKSKQRTQILTLL